MNNTLMIDLETTGKRPGCCILTIGAAGIDKNGKEVNFYAKIHHDKSKDEGFDDDPETLAWWRKQDTATLTEAFCGRDFPGDIVREFASFVGKNFNTQAKNFTVWSKGSDFDFPILKAYFEAYEENIPWPFWTQRDYRTLQAVFPFLKSEEKNGEKHNALEDAKAQMRGLEHFMSLEAVFKEKPKNVNDYGIESFFVTSRK